MAKQPSASEPTPSVDLADLSDVNARAAAAGAAVTTAEARGGSSSTGLVDVTTGDVPPA